MLNVFSRHAAPPAHVRFLGATALACAGLLGMSTVHAAEAEPPEPAATAPFKQYQGWREEPPQDWRQANERVGEIGGWRTYLRESQQGGDGADQGHHGHPGQ
jgi:hypothetical protein